MSRETEAKFAVGDLVSFNRVKSLRGLADFTLTDGEEVDVHDTYHDTPGRALLAAGWALRFREAGGQIVLTAKSLDPAAGAIHDREELSLRLDPLVPPAKWPDGELRRVILPLLGEEKLSPLFEVRQLRFVRRLARELHAVAEMSLDQVRILAGGREREYCELEIELLPDGTAADLPSILAALGNELALLPSPRSKFEEGLLLLDPPPVRPLARQKQALRVLPEGRTLQLEAPDGLGEESVLNELRRLGYRFRIRSRKEELRAYFDTQGGSLLRQDMELFFTAEDSRWRLHRAGRQEHAQKGERESPPLAGPVASAVRGVTRNRPGVPYLETTLRETSLSLVSLSTPRLGLVIRAWELRSLLHEASSRTALTMSLDQGQASSIERDYLAGLLKGTLGLTETEELVVAFGLRRLGAPLPGAPLPGEFLPAPGDDVSAVCRRILAGESWRMKANTPGAIRDLDPEFVHDLRVATRRARFACRLFVHTLGTEGRDRIRTELFWIAGLLGAVRDLDVLRGRLDSQLDSIDAGPSFRAVVDGLLEARRRSAREALTPALRSPRYGDLLVLMGSAVASQPEEGQLGEGQPEEGEGRQPAQEFARGRIAKALAKLAPWTKGDPGGFSADELHRLRILFKRLRYTAEFFRPVLSNDITPLVKECVAYQDCLGLHQDARVAVETFSRLAEDPALAGGRDGLLAMGALIQVQRDVMKAQREKFTELWGSAGRLFDLWTARRGTVR